MIIDNYSMAVPVVATSDVAGTVGYFEKTLGFKQQWIWGDPPVYAGVKAGGALLYINGADIAEELTARPWAARQYVVREPNKYHLKIAESHEPE